MHIFCSNEEFSSVKNVIFSRHDESRSDDMPDICEVSPLVSYSGEVSRLLILNCMSKYSHWIWFTKNLEMLVKGRVFEPPLVLDMDPNTKQVTFNGLNLNSFKNLYKIEPLDKFTVDLIKIE